METGKRARYLQYGLSSIILVGLIYAGFKYVNGGELVQALSSFAYPLIPAMLTINAFSLFLRGWRFVYLMRPISDLSSRIFVKGYIAGQSATLVPGGIAARAGLMKQVGVPLAKSSVPVAFVSLLDVLASLTGISLAAFFFHEARNYALISTGLFILAAVVVAIPQTRNWLDHQIGYLAQRFGYEQQWENFRSSLNQITQFRNLAPAAVISILAIIPKILTLDLALRGLGAEIHFSALFLAFNLPTILGNISAFPAGIGIVEAGMVGILSTYGAVSVSLATAAVVIFRITTVLFDALLGALVYVLAWRGERELQESTD